MRPQAMLVRSLVVLCAISGPGLAEVTVSQSNDPTAGYAAPLQQLFAGERSLLNAAPPVALRSLAPATSPRPPIRTASAAMLPSSMFDAEFIAAQPQASGGPEWACLTEALYFEARGESLRGQFAVAEVVVNRVKTVNYPNTVCGVVRQGAERRNGCQFSFACDGKPEVVRERDAWEVAGKISRMVLDGKHRVQTFGATHFHSRQVNPSWSRIFPRTAQIGAHLFYRHPDAPAPAPVAAPAPQRKPGLFARLAKVEATRSGTPSDLQFSLSEFR